MTEKTCEHGVSLYESCSACGGNEEDAVQDEAYWADVIEKLIRTMPNVEETENTVDAPESISVNEFHFYTYDDERPAFRVLVEPVPKEEA